MEGMILPSVLCHSTPSREISLNSFSFSSPCLSALMVWAFCTTGWHLIDNKYTALEMNFKC